MYSIERHSFDYPIFPHQLEAFYSFCETYEIKYKQTDDMGHDGVFFRIETPELALIADLFQKLGAIPRPPKTAKDLPLN